MKTLEEFAEKYAPKELVFRRIDENTVTYDRKPTADFLSDLRSVIRGELLRYKIWEDIFGSNYDTIEPMIDDYLKSQQ